jgi:hypothetical protein
MTRLSLEQLTPGLTLGKPVYNLNGVLLLRAGEVLTAKHLQIFKTWGVREVDVVGEEGSEGTVPADAPVPPEIAAAVEKEIARRFRRTDPADPVLADLRRLAGRRLTTRIMAEAAAKTAKAAR